MIKCSRENPHSGWFAEGRDGAASVGSGHPRSGWESCVASGPHTQQGVGRQRDRWGCCLSNDAKRSFSLFTDVRENLGARVLGEIETERFLALPDTGGHSELSPQTSVPTWGR